MAGPAKLNRRIFLQRTATGVAAAGTTAWMSASAAPPPSERVVVGLIGAGDFGRRQHLNRLLLPNPRVEVAAVCDVNQIHREMAARDIDAQRGKRVGVYKDFRDLLDRSDIDAVVIVTPEHWHALIAVAAMEAGKDVYCEKPLTLTIDEGKTLVATARRYGTVFQTGSQQRSDNHYFRQAYALVQAGRIGNLRRITTHLGLSPQGTWQQTQTPPSHLDWNFWLGPAPYVDYTPNRCNYHFRWYSDYSGGILTDHGAHQNDIAQWMIGADGSGPTKIEGTGQFHEDGPHDVLREFEVKFTYGHQEGIELLCTSQRSEFGASINLYGDNGRISVSRRRISASDPDIVTTESKNYDDRLLESYVRHYENWLDCIHTRERPLCDVEIGHRSVTVCHLANLAVRVGRPLWWNPDRETFVDDPAADRLLSRPMRSPWRI